MVEGRHLEKETEVMVCAAQEQALQVNSIKNHNDGQGVSAMSRLCGKSSETLIHLSSGCSVLASRNIKLDMIKWTSRSICCYSRSMGSRQEMSGTAMYPML